MLTQRIFIVCMLACAALALVFIWNGGPPAPIYFKVAATLFVVGFAHFLLWFSIVLNRLVRGETV